MFPIHLTRCGLCATQVSVRNSVASNTTGRDNGNHIQEHIFPHYELPNTDTNSKMSTNVWNGTHIIHRSVYYRTATN